MFKYRALQLNKFWYWMNERHRIYLKKKAGDKQPWTKDRILHEYKFTNVFRQLDRVTQEWEKRYVTVLGSGKKLSDGDLLFELLKFRIFNWPPTYDLLRHGLASSNWNKKRAVELLKAAKAEGKQLFTGAYIVTGGAAGEPKYETICEALEYAFLNKNQMARRIKKFASMERACDILQKIPTVGPFVAYEIACDLRHTRLLSHAKDVLSWANPGPGAKRGIHRLFTGEPHRMDPRPDYVAVMRDLLVRSETELGNHVKCEWPFEMREIEHSLCEFDKYMRVKNDEGRPRSKYTPIKPVQLGLFSMLPDDEDPRKAR